MSGPVHGKPSTYVNHKCRCRACRDAWAAQARAWRARRAEVARERPDLVPHGVNGYSNHGCRCEVCTSAHAEAQREQRARKSAPPFP